MFKLEGQSEGILLLKATEGEAGMLPLVGRNVVTMSVKPSEFWGQGRNKSRNIFVGGRNKTTEEFWFSGYSTENSR